MNAPGGMVNFTGNTPAGNGEPLAGMEAARVLAGRLRYHPRCCRRFLQGQRAVIGGPRVARTKWMAVRAASF